MDQEIIKITEKAREQILSISSKEKPSEDSGLRVGVVGGGCSGLSYKMEFSEPKATDHVIDINGFSVLIDPKSAIYLKDVELDYQDGLNGKGFVFVNPNASNTCGCGESFSV